MPNGKLHTVREKKILLNGQEFPVTSNLAAAIQHLQKQPGYYWIDAICIDQSNPEERGLQVSLMKAVFNRAIEVVIWLGERVDLPFMFNISTETKQPDAERSSFFCNSYWRRVWVVQEVSTASKIRIIHGNGHIIWEELVAYMNSALVLNQDFNTEASMGIECIQRLMDLRQGFRCHRPAYFLDLLYRSKSLLATDELDRVYGLLGLAHDSEIFLHCPQYGITLDRLYERMAMSVIENTGSLDILYFNRGAKRDALPTWVPRWLELQGDRIGQWINYTIQRSRSSNGFSTHTAIPRVLENMLVVQGRRIGVLDGLSSPCFSGTSSNRSPGVSVPMAQLGGNLDPYGSYDATVYAVLETVCRGHSLPKNEKGACFSQFHWAFQTRIKAHLGQWISENEDIKIRGESLSYWFDETAGQLPRFITSALYIGVRCGFSQFLTNDSVDGLSLFEPLAMKTARGFLDREEEPFMNIKVPHSEEKIFNLKDAEEGLLCLSSSEMRLVVTDEGLVGLAVKEASQGDVLVQLEGCERPIVLRRAKADEGAWQIVGEGWLYDASSASPVNCEICSYTIA
ncbi:heterokaryon incompatibility protein-domain-containing protein [Fusarium oxysporum]|nr:heterokaryon incompatibility protein-domain-containing protein [Fusarium oxysporum]